MRKWALVAVYTFAVSVRRALGSDSRGSRSDPLTGMPFVLIPAGEFEMGTPTTEPQRESQETLHQVTITRPFYLAVHEVTQREWQTVMGSNPSHFSACGPDCPVEQITLLRRRAVDRADQSAQRVGGLPVADRSRMGVQLSGGRQGGLWRVIVADDRRRQLRRTISVPRRRSRKISTHANTRWHVRSQSLGAVRHVG